MRGEGGGKTVNSLHFGTVYYYFYYFLTIINVRPNNIVLRENLVTL